MENVLIENYESSFISNHAQMRMKERVGVKNLDKMIRLAGLAVTRGIGVDTKKEVFARELEKHNIIEDREVLLYDGNFYVFTSDYSILVTVWPASANIRKKLDAYRRKENGNRASGYFNTDRDYYLEQIDMVMSF